jgi:hypothetical protein
MNTWEITMRYRITDTENINPFDWDADSLIQIAQSENTTLDWTFTKLLPNDSFHVTCRTDK